MYVMKSHIGQKYLRMVLLRHCLVFYLLYLIKNKPFMLSPCRKYGDKPLTAVLPAGRRLCSP
ncbi:protein of unknown function [Xenorhabdus nematophila AN6/1]|nr:protein of unknown function [Xenorhabdus nematophila AN6/1]